MKLSPFEDDLLVDVSERFEFPEAASAANCCSLLS